VVGIDDLLTHSKAHSVLLKVKRPGCRLKTVPAEPGIIGMNAQKLKYQSTLREMRVEETD
jgi:hypothetical protein